MTIQERQQEIIDDFSMLDDWMDRYQQIIDIAATLAPYPESLRTPEHLIDGCQSRVWIDATLDEHGHMHLKADSDAIIVKGIVALLIQTLDDQTPDDILAADLHFIRDIGLDEHLSPTRSNGLLAMIRQIHNYAIAYQAKGASGANK